MKNMDDKQSKLKSSSVYKNKEQEASINPEYVKKIRRIEKQKNIKIKDIDQFFNEI